MRITASQARHFDFWLFGVHLALALVMSACSATPPAAAPDRVNGDEPGTIAVTDIAFYYPISVGGPITQIVEQMVEEFHASNPDVRVTPVFAGSYADSFTKIVTALDGGGAPPAVAVLLSSDLLALLDSDAIVPLDDLLQELDESARPDFFSGFMLNSTFRGKTWGLPFQRSTPVLYYNKDLFRTAGLDPDRPPESWAEQIEYARAFDAAGWSSVGLRDPGRRNALLAIPGYCDRESTECRG